MNNILTCVYCGHEYPARTPASGSEVAQLTDHIKVCEKHPMRDLESKNIELLKALGLITGLGSVTEVDGVINITQKLKPEEVGLIEALKIYKKYLQNI